MKSKNYLTGLILVGFSFALVGIANAAWVWEPQVQIPGIPTTGVTLSMYLVGLYNFLLSVVGIVAVMMLIVGGMRLITAAGNSAALSSGKEIISNALVGLLLALLSWVFISTINPDALYLKKPGSGFTYNISDIVGADAGNCYKSYDPTTNACICGDGTSLTTSNIGDCISECKSGGFCTLIQGSCVRKVEDSSVFTVNTKCFCNSGYDWEQGNDWWKPEPTWFNNPATSAKDKNCDYVCSHPAAVSDGKYHGTKLTVMVSKNQNMTNAFEFTPYSNLDLDTTYYFDLSQSRDCLYDIITYALEFEDGAPLIWDFLVDRGCCTVKENNNCTSLGKANLACKTYFKQCVYPGPRFDYKTPSKASVEEKFWVGLYMHNGPACDIGAEREIKYILGSSGEKE
ncbi:hypothetical protein K0B03_04515 [Patescibacteria group bacterium]|nr:hypothetical protein [Patescibacteria group bacterium]